MKEKQILTVKRSELYRIYQQQMQMSATIPELSRRNYEARDPAKWEKEWQNYLAFLNAHLKPLFRLVHGTGHLPEIKACNEIRASGDRAQSDSVVWNGHTGGGISRTQWIYFSLRLPPYECVSFIGGGKAKIVIDLNKLDDDQLLKGMWFAAHISVFSNNGIISAQKFGAVTRRAYYYREKKIGQKADDQILCLSAQSGSMTHTKKYLYSDMIFSAEDGLENFFENIFRFFIEQLQFCAKDNPFFQELLGLAEDNPSKLSKTIHLWNLIFQGDSFELCVPGPIPLDLSCIEIDEQRNYFKNTTLIFSLIETNSASPIRDAIKKTLRENNTAGALQKAFNRQISPNIRSILKEPAVIRLVKRSDMKSDFNPHKILSLFLENGVDIQVRDATEHSLLEHIAEKSRPNAFASSNRESNYFSALIIEGVQRDVGIIEYFNIAMNHTHDICEQFYTSPFFLENILAFAENTPIIEDILPHCIIRANVNFLYVLLKDRMIELSIHNQDRLTPLMIAIKEKLPLPLIQLIASKSKNINAQTSDSSHAGWTALHFAVNTSRPLEEQLTLIQFLLENNVDIATPGQNGETPGMLLERLSVKYPKQYLQLQESISHQLKAEAAITPQLPQNKSVLISVLIRVQETDYVLMIRKPISYSLLLEKRHLPTHAIGQWWLPGGLIDANETAIQAAARELFEETGFKIDETDLIEIAPNPNVPIQLSLIISKRIIAYEELPLIFASSDAAAVFWVPYSQNEWQETKHNDLLWRKSNWLLVKAHMQFIKNDLNTDFFSAQFLITFAKQLDYEEKTSFHALGDICSKRYVEADLLISDSDYSQFKESLNNWLMLGGAFNIGNCQELTRFIITVLAKRKDYDFYLELLKYGLDPNIIFIFHEEHFNLITHLLALNMLLTQSLQTDLSLTEEQRDSLQQNSANFLQFSLQMYQGIHGNYSDFSAHSILSFVCRYNLHSILEQLIPLGINRNGYAVGCALVNALMSNEFRIIERLLEISSVDLNQAYHSQNILKSEIYPIEIFFQDVLIEDAPNTLQRLISRGLRVIAFIERIFYLKETLELQKSNIGNAVEEGFLSLANAGLLSQQQLASLAQACLYSRLSRSHKQLEIKAKVLKIFEIQLAREISMLCIESKSPYEFFSPSSISTQKAEIQSISDNTDKDEAQSDFSGTWLNNP